MVINRVHLPPQGSPFSVCHHSRPSLPQSLMVLELPFIPLSLRLCVSSPFRSPNQRTGLLVGRWCWPLLLCTGDSFSFVLGLHPPRPPYTFAKADQTPGGSGRERGREGEPLGVHLIVFPFTSETSGPGVDIRRRVEPHTLKGQCPHKVTAPVGRGMHVNGGGSKTSSDVRTWDIWLPRTLSPWCVSWWQSDTTEEDYSQTHWS